MNERYDDSDRVERHSPERFARETELDRRISNLETSEKELTDSVNRLAIQIEKLATITESMERAITAITERERQMQEIQIDVANLKSSMKNISFVMGAFVAAGAGMILKFLFTNGGV